MLGLSVRNGDSPENVGAPSGWAGTNTQLGCGANDGSTTLQGAPGNYLSKCGAFLAGTLWWRQSLEQPLVWFQDGLAHITSDLGAGPAWKSKFGGVARRKHC